MIDYITKALTYIVMCVIGLSVCKIASDFFGWDYMSTVAIFAYTNTAYLMVFK